MDYTVPSGGSSKTKIDLTKDDTLSVQSGGTASACTAMSGGVITGFASGVVISCTVSGAYFQSGGTTVLSSGVIVLKGGSGTSNTVMAGGAEHVSNGGVETDAFVYGRMFVSNGGSAIRTSVFTGGSVDVQNGATMRAAAVHGGVVAVHVGGQALFGNIYNGGRMEVLNENAQRANAQNVTVQNGGVMAVAGAANGTTIQTGGTLELQEKGYVYGAQVYGQMIVSSGGTANYTSVCDGGRCVVSSGASMYNTTVSQGGLMTVEAGGEVRSITTIKGGELQMRNVVVSSPRDSTVSGASMLITNGGRVSVSTMTIESGGLVSLDSKSTLLFQNIVKSTSDNVSGVFAFAELESYDPRTGICRKALDCTATVSSWYENDYKNLLACDEPTFSSAFAYSGGDLYMRGHAYVSSGADGNETFDTIESAKALRPTGFVIMDGTFGASSNIPTFEALPTVISGGTFDTSICGGTFFNQAETGDESMNATPVEGDISLSIEDGTFKKIVFAGDRVNVKRAVERTGDIVTTISGGSFYNAVAGAMAYTYTPPTEHDKPGSITLIGDVSLTISGGDFSFGNGNNKDWIYGGCLSTNKQLAAQTFIQGNVTVTIDATDDDVTVGNVVAGSYGEGTIMRRALLDSSGDVLKDSETGYTIYDETTGHVTLVLKGENDIVATGEIWGGCSGDKYKTNRYETTVKTELDDGSSVEGRRTLSFSGFTGELRCDQIRAFNYAEFVKSGSTWTDATLTDLNDSGILDMSYIENWTFEKDCCLSGNFENDFAGDTLNLTNLTPGGQIQGWVIFENGSDDGFRNFSELEIRINGGSVGEIERTENALSWSWSGIDYTLTLDSYWVTLTGYLA